LFFALSLQKTIMGNKPIVINKIETGSSVGCGVFLSETCDGICDF